MSAKFTLEGSGGGAIKAIQDLQAALAATEKNAEGAVRAAKRLEDQARRIAEQADPQLKYNRQMQELAEHVKAGRIQMESAEKAAGMYARQLADATGETKRQADAEKAAAEAVKRKEEANRKSLAIILESGRRNLQLLQQQDRANEELRKEEERRAAASAAAAQKIRESINPQEKLNRLYRELGEHVKRGELTIEEATQAGVRYRQELMGVEKASEQTFGAGLASKIAGAVASYLSLSRAISLVTQALREQEEQSQAAADRAKAARPGLGALSQLAATMGSTRGERVEAFKSLVKEARSFVSSGAAADDNEAGNLLFELASAGLDRTDRTFAANLRAKGTLQNVAGAAQAFDALTTALGREEVGNFQEFASKALQAAAVAPGSFEALPVAITKAGGSAKALGISDEFLLAAGAILAKKTKSPEEGATQLAAFLAAAEKSGVKGIEGVGGLALVERFAALPKSKQGFGGVFGDRKEAVEGFRTLRDELPLLRELEGDITKASQTNLAGEAASLTVADPQLRSGFLRTKAEGDLAQRIQDLDAERENLLDTLRSRRLAQARLEGRGAFSRFLTSSGFAISDVLNREDVELEVAVGNPEVRARSGLTDEDVKAIRDYLRRNAEASEEIQRNQRAKATTRQE